MCRLLGESLLSECCDLFRFICMIVSIVSRTPFPCERCFAPRPRYLVDITDRINLIHRRITKMPKYMLVRQFTGIEWEKMAAVPPFTVSRMPREVASLMERIERFRDTDKYRAAHC